MKIGYLTDIHMKGETPEGRIDNFSKSLLLKLEECGEIWRKEECKAVLMGGDWFDKPDVSNSVIYDLLGVLKKWNVEIYGIIGSHDYCGYQIKSLKRTAIGLVDKSGVIELIGSEGMRDYVILNNEILVCGTPHTYWLDDSPDNYYKERYSKDLFQIQLTHGDLLDKLVPWKHTLIKDVKTESDLVLGAHYHPGWNEVKYGKTLFINPGSIARLDNTGKSRIPKVLILNIDSRKCISKYIT